MVATPGTERLGGEPPDGSQVKEPATRGWGFAP